VKQPQPRKDVHIRRFTAYEWQVYKDLRLRALADAPDAFGSTLASEQTRPDDDWAARLAGGVASGLQLPLLAEVDGAPAGLTWARIDDNDSSMGHIYQVWVAPEYRRLGAGRMLMQTVIGWAQAKNVRCLELGVTWADSPAVRLYLRNGFQPVSDPEPIRLGSELLGRRMRLELQPGGCL
jgi:ribosomal protein S18 acetylase RimI-like enzyme